MRADPYRATDQGEWNAFVAGSKNGTFLHDRRYMEYHAARFADASLILRDGDRIAALLPANRDGNRVVSHQGLTYGGLIVDPCATYAEVEACMHAIRSELMRGSVRELVYKAVPRIYHALPADEDLCALGAAGAALVQRDLLSVVDLSNRLKPQERRRRGAAKAGKAGTIIAESRNFAGFWEVLEATLRGRHEAKPVHSLEEILLLAERFPDNIRLHLAERGGEILGGTVIYATSTVARSQYIAASPVGLELGALDLMFLSLLDDAYAAKKYFDFGTSRQVSGGINTGLLEQKEGFGARAIVQHTFEVTL